MYQARILDKNRKLVAILPGVRWHYTRRINEATEISIYIPRETIDEVITQDHPLYGFFGPSQPFVVQAKPQRNKPNKAQYAEIAAYVQIFKGDKLKASGKINSRTLDQIVTVSAYTEEILLEGNLTPAQYGKVWDNWDLADVARDLLDGWQTIRVKAPEQWQQYMVDSHRVDLTTEPGTVMLAKRSDGRYYDSGYITLVFNKIEIPHFKSWDRVRWSADSEEPVKTSIQISTNGTSFSAPFDGGLPEEVGYYIGGDHDQVWVRINLSTSDTESEDENGNKVGVTPTVFALEVIARTEGKLAAGNIPAVAGATVKGLSADHATAFNVLKQACEQAGWEFSVWNGALNIAEALGVDRTKDFVLRAGTNMEITSLGDDDKELVNILTAYGPGSGINRMEITLRDEDSIAQFGPYPKAMEFEAETLAELEQKAQEYLDSHNTPTVAFEVAAVFDFEHEPEYGLGDVVRVADPETGIVTTTRIMAEAREYNEQGLSVHLELGKAGFTLAEAISGEKRVAKPIDPMQPTGVYARGIVAGIRVGFAEPKMDDWAYSEVHVSTAPHFEPSGGTLRDKGKQTRFDIMELTPGVRYYAKVVHVDNAGRRSEPSQEVSAVANYMSPELLPDYSLGVDKFMEGLKPPIMVTSKPNFPDPRYPDDTILFYTVDSRLYRVVGNNWVPLTVTDFSELSGQIQSNQIALDAIKEDLIAAGAIASRHIQIEAVTAEKIAHEAVQTEHIDTGAITETKISDNAISAPKIKTGAIEADKIAANAVTATKIAANAVTANKIAAGAVETEKLAANAITAEKIAAGAIETNHISAGAVKADQIDANAVTATKILAGAITADKIGANAVTTNKIAAGAVTSEKIYAGAVTADKIAAGAITAEKLAADAVTADMVVAGIVQAGGIKADWYAEIRNVLPYVGTDSLDEDNPIEVDFYIPTETDSIVSIKLSAKALRYRAYARTTSSGGSHAHEVVIPSHSHPITLITDNGLAYTRDAGEHTHGYGSTGATSSIHDIEITSGGSHSHAISGSTDTNAHSHSVSVGLGGDPGHTHPAGTLADRHSHSVNGSTDTGGSHSGHISSIVRGVHSHSISDAGAHGHLVDYSIVIPFSVTESAGGTISTSEYADAHSHPLAYGIMLDTTPADVMLYCHDGTSYDTGVALSSAPTNPTQEYVLATELDLTSAFTGTGWKRIKFTSSRRGRITWQLIVKLDITA